MPQQRVVLDTNVVLSALLFQQGALVWLRHAWQSYAILPLDDASTIQAALDIAQPGIGGKTTVMSAADEIRAETKAEIVTQCLQERYGGSSGDVRQWLQGRREGAMVLQVHREDVWDLAEARRALL